MQSKRSLRFYLGLSGKGMMMGAADAVPGVSGGTIAFITGIYEELIHSLRQFGLHALMTLFKQGPVAAWRYVNGTFLLALFGGVLLSIITMSGIILHLLDTYPELLWSFFFGLILAGIWSMVRHIEKWNAPLVIAFVVGTIVAYAITSMTPANMPATPLYLVLAGSIAVCAMILPGISGSFILLLLGLYAPVLAAVKNLELVTLSLFASGCVVGLLSFSHVLSWMFRSFKEITLALLGGFMLGALNKVWPWKQTIESMINSHGKEVPLVQKNLLPQVFEAQTGQSSQLILSVSLMLIGAALVIVMEHAGQRSDETSSS